jgi:type IX secretion system PorP/SprF family membrane protein
MIKTIFQISKNTNKTFKKSQKHLHVKTINLFFTFYFLLFTFSSLAQDLHFSQFFNSPLSTNPANTGFIADADYRTGAHYRNQYSNIMSSPYKTMSVFGDAQVFRDKLENGWMGFGFLALSDLAGSGSLKSTKLYGSVAYHQMLGNSSLFSGGFNVGYVNKRIDVSGLKFPDQFDGYFFDSNLPTSVVLDNTSVSYLDIQAGVNYAFFPNDDIYINAGYSIHHVNKPKESFFNENNGDGLIPMRHIGFVNAIIKLNDRVILKPNLFYTNQVNASAFEFGTLADINLSEKGEKQLIAGCYYRWKDAVMPMLGFQLNQLQFTFSYDATISTLKNFNQYRGAAEFSIIKNGFYGNKADRQSLCPSF